MGGLPCLLPFPQAVTPACPHYRAGGQRAVLGSQAGQASLSWASVVPRRGELAQPRPGVSALRTCPDGQDPRLAVYVRLTSWSV